MTARRPLRPYTIPGPAGPLEVLQRPASGGEARGAALLCHPHPLHGGTMHSRVVHHLSRALGDAGYMTLRFNFRGVGASGGVHDEGAGEVEDALAALEHLGRLCGEPPTVIAGHSFGAWVGLRAGVEDPHIRTLVAAGMPVSLYDFAFLAGARAQLMVIQGDRDPFGPSERLRALQPAWPDGSRLEVIPGADHFFEAHLPDLRAAVIGFLEGEKKAPETG